jgi:transcription elongation factor GreA
MATERQLKLTREGKSRLEEELRQLREERLKELSQRIQAANEEGDISDNSEFEELKEEYYYAENRVREIQDILSRSVILEEGSVDGTIGLGSRITVQADDDDEPEHWMLVNEEESSALEGRISDESPVGIALLGKRAGDTVTIKTAGGGISYNIIDVK